MEGGDEFVPIDIFVVIPVDVSTLNIIFEVIFKFQTRESFGFYGLLSHSFLLSFELFVDMGLLFSDLQETKSAACLALAKSTDIDLIGRESSLLKFEFRSYYLKKVTIQFE